MQHVRLGGCRRYTRTDPALTVPTLVRYYRTRTSGVIWVVISADPRNGSES